MGVVEFTDTFSSAVPAPKLFKAWIVDNHTVLPKADPDHVKTAEVVSGNGGPGTIKLITFAEGLPIKFLKYKIDAIDESSLSYADTVIEGGELSDKIEKVSHEVKFASTPEGGCSFTSVTKFHTKEGESITEEEVKAGKEAALGLLKAVESYALAN